MKNIFKIVLLIMTLNINAQITTPMEQMVNFTRTTTADNRYFSDVNGLLNKFLGNWKYQNGIDLVEITIYIEEMKQSGGGYYYDDIYIKFKYTKDGSVVFDTYNLDKNYLINGGDFRFANNLNKVHLMYSEPEQNSSIYQTLNIEYLPNGGSPLLNWVMSYEPANSKSIPPLMPVNMVFVKVP